jgi:hypothetical protein
MSPQSAQAAPAQDILAQPTGPRNPVQIPAEIVTQIRTMLSNPLTRADGMKLYQTYAAPKDQWSQQRGADGSIYQRNATTGEVKVIEKSDVLPPTAVQQKVEIAAAGKPVTNINQQQESEYEKATGKQLAEANMEIIKSSSAARGKIATLNRLGTMLVDPNIYTGKAAESVLELKRLGKAIGVEVGDVGPAEAVKSISNQFALELRNPAGGAGMPGALSDKDREFLQSMVPGLNQNPHGNALIIDYMKRVAQRSVDVERLRQQYVRKNGRLGENFYTELADYSDANPLFSESDMKAAAPIPSPSGGQNIDDLLRKYGGAK